MCKLMLCVRVFSERLDRMPKSASVFGASHQCVLSNPLKTVFFFFSFQEHFFKVSVQYTQMTNGCQNKETICTFLEIPKKKFLIQVCSFDLRDNFKATINVKLIKMPVQNANAHLYIDIYFLFFFLHHVQQQQN